jgi:acyl-CoA thioester hydrolase
VTPVIDGDPRRTVADHYPRPRHLRLKYSDQDLPGVIGGIAIARLFEEGRYTIRSTIDHPQARDPNTGFVLARVRIDVLEPVTYPGEVGVAMAVGGVGRTSFDYVSALFQNGNCVALSDATVAVRDRRSGRGRLLDASFRTTLAELALGGEPDAPGE